MIRLTLGDRSYDYDGKMRYAEAIRVQKVTGRTIGSIEAGGAEGDIESLGAILWVAMTRTGEQVRYADLDFELSELKVASFDEAGREIDADGNLLHGEEPGEE